MTRYWELVPFCGYTESKRKPTCDTYPLCRRKCGRLEWRVERQAFELIGRKNLDSSSHKSADDSAMAAPAKTTGNSIIPFSPEIGVFGKAFLFVAPDSWQAWRGQLSLAEAGSLERGCLLESSGGYRREDSVCKSSTRQSLNHPRCQNFENDAGDVDSAGMNQVHVVSKCCRISRVLACRTWDKKRPAEPRK